MYESADEAMYKELSFLLLMRREECKEWRELVYTKLHRRT